MIPTSGDIQRTARAVKDFGFDPRDIGGDKHIRWWFATKQDEHFDHDQQGQQDCFVGDVKVVVRGTGRFHAVNISDMRENWVTMIQHRDGSVSYIFKPLSKVTTQEE